MRAKDERTRSPGGEVVGGGGEGDAGKRPPRPRKRFGQHFLVNRRVAERVVALADLKQDETVLEIGPGRGALSSLLAERVGKLYLVEVDRDLAGQLRERFAGVKGIEVITGDILGLNLFEAFAESRIKVVANLPYNIATEILFRLLAARSKFHDLTLMLQQEVAARLRALPCTPDYGVPTLLVQLYAQVEQGFLVSPGSFHPRPRVTSEVVRLKLSPQPRFPLLSPEGEKLFTTLVRAAFGQRRKMLRSALRSAAFPFESGNEMWETVFSEAGVEASLRGEQVDIDGFVALANALAQRWRDGVKG